MWQGVPEGVRGQGLVEGGIKHGHLPGLRKQALGYFDAQVISRVVQGREGKQLADGGFHQLVNFGGGGELFAPVHYPVPHHVDFGRVTDGTSNGTGEQGHHLVQADFVVGQN